ncbi:MULTISPECIES: MFS transporter [unclassified Pseudomonas]|uniref:MFS transporter n=1 Tax=unclassified Pseudomonas TaxID=196821 RepID=UPI00209854C9|nr:MULTISPECIES: MFS transporter [unclassified Pseudomonas]MCO7520226.1 MFS transporter [Pseudomonas sp. 1]MCO7540012.1 MFS transporter [Pseudomonas sp. VA159-2]
MTALPEHPPARWSELLSGGNALRSIALAGGVALHAINVYIVTTLLPTVIGEIGGLAFYAWNTTLFVVASIIGSTLSTRLLARSGPRLAYLLALLVFAAGSVLCAQAASMPMLLVGRSVQGLGGGILFALSYALIHLVFEHRLWPRAMALVSAMWGVATLCGPAVGGVFAEGGHWRWAFWALLPVAALLALIVCLRLPGRQALDGNGARPAYGLIACLVASVLAICAASLSEVLWINLLGIVAGLAIAALIARLDPGARHHLLPSGAYSLRQPMGALFAIMCLLVAAITTEIYVPYFLQHIHGFGPLSAGYLTAVMAAGWTLGALASAGRDRDGGARQIRLGPLVVTAALLALALLTPQPTWLAQAPGLALYTVALAGVGLGIGLGWPHLLTRVLQAARPGEENLASASITTVQLYATALAAALAGLVSNSAGLVDPGGVGGARQAATWLFALFACAPLLAIPLARRITRPSARKECP